MIYIITRERLEKIELDIDSLCANKRKQLFMFLMDLKIPMYFDKNKVLYIDLKNICDEKILTIQIWLRTISLP